MKCSNANRGCEWVGTVNTLEKHVATCGFTLVPCPKQCKNDSDEVNHFIRKDLYHHLKNACRNRDYECQSKCGEKGTYAYITEIHDKTCKMKILSCPNAGCDAKVQRQQVSEHVSKCPHTVIPCKYKGIGCDTELERKDMAAHEQDDKLHLHMALEAVISLRAAVETLQVEVYSQHDRLRLSKNDLWTFRLSEYQLKKDSNKQFKFPPFYTHPTGYHMALQVYVNGEGAAEGTHVSVYAAILKGEYDARLKWPIRGRVTFALLNQLEEKNHHTKTMELYTVDNTHPGSFWGFAKFIPHSALAHDPVKNTQYLKNDTLYFRMEVVTKHKP